VAVFPQDTLAEGVYGAYLRPLAQGALAAEAPVFRVLRQSPADAVHYAAAQLRGGGAGEGDNKEAVYILRVVFVREVAHKPLGEHAGLAAARGGGHQHGAASGLHGFLLGRGGAEFRHCRRPLSVCPKPGRASFL